MLTQSIIRIYADAQKTTLLHTISTSGDSVEIDALGLDAGTTYWATVTVGDSNGQQSQESTPYEFHTLPNIGFDFQPQAVGKYIAYQMSSETNDVGVRRIGLMYTTDPELASRPTIVWFDQPSVQADLTGLAPDTVYYLTPVVQDEYGRIYYNYDAMVGVRTGVEVPTIALTNVIAYSTTAEGNVTVASTAPLTALSVRLLPLGGGNYINATGYTTQTGLQHWTVSGLTPNTTYTVYASASNSGGSATATYQLTTNDVSASVSLDDFSLVHGHEEDSVYVEALGTGVGIDIDTVGVKFYTVESHSGTPIADVYGQQGEASIQTTCSTLPNGEYVYGFAYMDFTVGNDTDTVWSESEKVLTAPTVNWGTIIAVSATEIASSIVPHGSVISTKYVEYKESGTNVWTQVSVTANNGFSITGLNPSTAYDLRAVVSNASGERNATTTFTTSPAAPTVTVVNATNITSNSADINLTITI